MQTNQWTYVFGRLNLIASYNNKTNYISESLNSHVHMRVGDYGWSFFDIKNLFWQDEFFLYGFLVKYKLKTNDEVVDREKHMFSSATISDKVIAKSPFLLHPSSGVIGYHPVTNKISNNQFRKNFSELIEKANEYLLVDAELQTIDEEGAILEAIKNFDKIYTLSITLHPSNPSNRERWKKTDDKLKKMRAEKYQEIYESKAGLEIDADDEAFDNVLMAEDGYGKASLRGISDGRMNTASTEKMPVKAVIDKVLDPYFILRSLIHKFQSIWDRTKH